MSVQNREKFFCFITYISRAEGAGLSGLRDVYSSVLCVEKEKRNFENSIFSDSSMSE